VPVSVEERLDPLVRGADWRATGAHGDVWVWTSTSATDTTGVRRAAALSLILLAVSFVVGGVVTTLAPEGDLGRSNLVQIGLMYVLLGLCLGFAGALLFRPK
jgi:hypothetical protein